MNQVGKLIEQLEIFLETTPKKKVHYRNLISTVRKIVEKPRLITLDQAEIIVCNKISVVLAEMKGEEDKDQALKENNQSLPKRESRIFTKRTEIDNLEYKFSEWLNSAEKDHEKKKNEILPYNLDNPPPIQNPMELLAELPQLLGELKLFMSKAKNIDPEEAEELLKKFNSKEIKELMKEMNQETIDDLKYYKNNQKP